MSRKDQVLSPEKVAAKLSCFSKAALMDESGDPDDCAGELDMFGIVHVDGDGDWSCHDRARWDAVRAAVEASLTPEQLAEFKRWRTAMEAALSVADECRKMMLGSLKKD